MLKKKRWSLMKSSGRRPPSPAPLPAPPSLHFHLVQLPVRPGRILDPGPQKLDPRALLGQGGYDAVHAVHAQGKPPPGGEQEQEPEPDFDPDSLLLELLEPFLSRLLPKPKV